jgi:hypothetical protein
MAQAKLNAYYNEMIRKLGKSSMSLRAKISLIGKASEYAIHQVLLNHPEIPLSQIYKFLHGNNEKIATLVASANALGYSAAAGINTYKTQDLTVLLAKYYRAAEDAAQANKYTQAITTLYRDTGTLQQALVMKWAKRDYDIDFTVDRVAHAGACHWCQEQQVFGVPWYKFTNWGRHANCGCIIRYKRDIIAGGKGSMQAIIEL